MEWNRVKLLYDKYLEGETSLDEERELHALLSATDINPKKYKAIKAILDATYSISLEKCTKDIKYSEPKRSVWYNISIRRIASVAAVVGLIVGIAISSIETAPSSAVEEFDIVCHINGALVTDQLVVQAEAQRILGDISQNMNTAKERINNITKLTSNR